MGSYVKKKIEYLVVDTSGFINKAAIQDIGENILTVPQVIEEVKSKRQIRRLVVLPYDLTVKEALPENIKFVTEFSKKTGDYASLSLTDINILALTYQLEKEKNGIGHLRSAPISKPVIAPGSTIPNGLTEIAGFYFPRKKSNSETQPGKSSEFNQNVGNSSEYDSAEDVEYYSADDQEPHNPSEGKDTDHKKLESKENCFNDIESHLSQNSDKKEEPDSEPQEKQVNDDEVDANAHDKNENDTNDEGDDADSDTYDEGDDADNEEDDDDSYDDCHWITQNNIEKAKNQIASELNADFENLTVACLTTDFAIQNVLKQIGLNVVSLDGKLIKQLRTFILRCYGCFKTTSNMSKVFCPNCGNKTLKKVGFSLDADGNQHLHINFRKPLSARGKKYSVPHFKGGKHSNNPVICEDQPMPQQRPTRLSRTKNNPLNDDYLAGYSPFVTRDVTSKSAMLGIKPHLEMKHWMRKNPNESRKKKK